MSRLLKPFLMRTALPPLAWRLARLLGRSWRYVEIGKENLTRALASDRPMIGAFFHGRMIPLLDYFSLPGNGPCALMCSKSLDGDLLAGIFRGLGHRPIRGSSGKGGMQALLEMIRHARRDPSWPVGLAVDGSRGPRGRVQTGVIALAQKTGGLIMPAAASARNGYVFHRSWERSLLPLPFARVYVGCGELIEVPRRLTEREVETYRLRVENAIVEMQHTLDRLSGFRDTAPLQAPGRRAGEG